MSLNRTIDLLYQYKAWANDELFNALLCIDKVKHAEEVHAATRILNHIYVVDRLFKAQLLEKTPEFTDTNTEETPELDTLYSNVQIVDQWYIDYSAGLNQQELSENIHFTFVDGDSGRMSREEILLHIVTHGGYHRGAVGRIMAQLSIAPPRDIFTRYLHDSDPNRRKS
ncbi:MAG: DinB family protein [Arenicella sp.]